MEIKVGAKIEAKELRCCALRGFTFAPVLTNVKQNRLVYP